jgi:hypothetical protein
MKKQLFALTMAMAVAFASSTAKADDFSYTFTGNDGVVATGTLTGSAVSTGVFDITSGTITLTGAPACNNCGALSGPMDGNGVFATNPGTGVFQTGGGSELILDGTNSLLYPSANQLIDNAGILLFQMDSGLGVGLFSNEPNGPGYGMFGGNWTLGDSGDLNVTSGDPSATPEPSSLMLLGTGLLGVAGAARNKFRRVLTSILLGAHGVDSVRLFNLASPKSRHSHKSNPALTPLVTAVVHP